MHSTRFTGLMFAGLFGWLTLGGLSAARAAEPLSTTNSKAEPAYTRTEDVVYGRRDGHALTMDVFTPTGTPNGAGVIIFVSAEFRSGRDFLGMIHPIGTVPMLERGYTLFAVLLSSQPKYTVPEIVEDAHRSVRYVKHHAKKFGIDPAKIGVSGGSAGGHLALMMGCAGTPGDPKDADPVNRQSSKAAAVACLFPPTNFLVLDGDCPKDLAAPFDIHEIDAKTGMYERVSAERRREIGKAISPLTHVRKGAAPTLIIHGDKDKLVPISQSESMIDKLNSHGVECKLIVKAGKGHFWLGIEKEVPVFADWFDAQLLGRKSPAVATVETARR